jgi:hypothetical protein
MRSSLYFVRPVVELWLHKGKVVDGFGGLVVHMLASGSSVRGFKPGRSLWIFLYIKILSVPSLGGEVKKSVPCPNFAARKRTLHLQ